MFKLIGKIIFAVVVIALLIFGGVLTFSKGATLNAEGSAEIKAMPDETFVYVRITAKNESAQVAKDKVNEITDKLQTELIKLGIEQKDIQLQDYDVYPWTEWISNKNVEKGFVVTQGIVVKVKDNSKVLQIVDKAIDAGALISYIDFGLSEQKENEYKAEALEKAAANARLKAESAASGLGKRIGGVVSVETVQEPYWQPYRYYEGGLMGGDVVAVKEAAANIAPRESIITASVKVTYKLKRFWLF